MDDLNYSMRYKLPGYIGEYRILRAGERLQKGDLFIGACEFECVHPGNWDKRHIYQTQQEGDIIEENDFKILVYFRDINIVSVDEHHYDSSTNRRLELTL